MLYEILSKQAQVILNLADLSNAGLLDVQLAKQMDYGNRMEDCLDQKRVLYERLLLQEISVEEYKRQKAAVDRELERLREIQSALKAQTAQMQSDEKVKSTRTKLAQEVVGASGLTAELVDVLIDRVYVYQLNAEYAQLLEQKKAAYPAYRKTRAEMQEYLVAQKVAAVLLEKEKELEAVEERRKQEQRTDQQR